MLKTPRKWPLVFGASWCSNVLGVDLPPKSRAMATNNFESLEIQPPSAVVVNPVNNFDTLETAQPTAAPAAPSPPPAVKVVMPCWAKCMLVGLLLLLGSQCVDFVTNFFWWKIWTNVRSAYTLYRAESSAEAQVRSNTS